MEINEALLLKLEKLARLQLSDTERTRLVGDLQNIIHMLDTLQTLDTADVEPLVYLNDTANVFRADETGAQWSASEALRNAPDQDGRYFRVPKMK
jgi:aspartyl-tRNA(Asn)/glutamyl-tRNA(Gln) amidotransferase subunit C